MDEQLAQALPRFTDIQTYIIRGITHTHIRVIGTSLRLRKPGFLADIYIHRRTQTVSISRIDTGDVITLYAILAVLSRFQF